MESKDRLVLTATWQLFDNRLAALLVHHGVKVPGEVQFKDLIIVLQVAVHELMKDLLVVNKEEEIRCKGLVHIAHWSLLKNWRQDPVLVANNDI